MILACWPTGSGRPSLTLLGLESTDPFGPPPHPEAPVEALIHRLAKWHMIELPD